jgi:hypothetical protein
VATIQLQFHAVGTELVELARRWAIADDMHVAVEQFFPDYVAFEPADRGAAVAVANGRVDRVRRIAVRHAPFDLSATTTLSFVSLNPDALFLSVEWPSTDGLRESAVDGATERPEVMASWRAFRRQARASMHVGAVVRGPNSPAIQAARHHLHTVGAHQLAETGVPMLAAAGWVEFLFDDLRRPTVRR